MYFKIDKKNNLNFHVLNENGIIKLKLVDIRYIKCVRLTQPSNPYLESKSI